jgi:hypothetical protein
MPSAPRRSASRLIAMASSVHSVAVSDQGRYVFAGRLDNDRCDTRAFYAGQREKFASRTERDQPVRPFVDLPVDKAAQAFLRFIQSPVRTAPASCGLISINPMAIFARRKASPELICINDDPTCDG